MYTRNFISLNHRKEAKTIQDYEKLIVQLKSEHKPFYWLFNPDWMRGQSMYNCIPFIEVLLDESKKDLVVTTESLMFRWPKELAEKANIKLKEINDLGYIVEWNAFCQNSSRCLLGGCTCIVDSWYITPSQSSTHQSTS